jgi:hypothetical protein
VSPFWVTEWCGEGEAVNLDPNTQAFVYATAFLTSVAFMVAVLNVLAVVLSHVLR